jgi:hypothetical protein
MDIDLDANYEDDDYHNYFDNKASLLDLLTHLEEDNLFRIHLV